MSLPPFSCARFLCLAFSGQRIWKYMPSDKNVGHPSWGRVWNLALLAIFLYVLVNCSSIVLIKCCPYSFCIGGQLTRFSPLECSAIRCTTYIVAKSSGVLIAEESPNLKSIVATINGLRKSSLISNSKSLWCDPGKLWLRVIPHG